MNTRGPLVALLLLAGCAAGTPSQTASSSPSASPAAAASVAPSPTATPTATPTPAPTATPITTDVDSTTRAGVGFSILQKAPDGAPVCKFGDTVAMEYTGWLTNGTKFDSSVGKAPFVFKIGAGRVIEGWDLGVPGMAVGEVRKLVLPPDLAYGDQGFGNSIPAGATLIFQVKLVEIQIVATPIPQ